MTMIEIKKEEIVEALETEPLRAGYWVDFTTRNPGGSDRSLGECRVCAVGALFRHKLAASTPAEEVSDHIHLLMMGDVELADAGAAYEYLEKSNYLAAMSCVFEGTRGSIKKKRDATIEFVAKNFPPTIFLDVDGFQIKESA